MTSKEILSDLKALENPGIKKIFLKHGAKEPFYGVKVEQLKEFQKKIKTNTALAIELYDSGVSDAMYLAGLIANGAEMNKKQLQQWAEKAPWYMISEYTVPWVAAESKFATELALQWIDNKTEFIASTGWATLSSYVAVTPDENLDIKLLKTLLKRVADQIHKAPNRVCYTMNGFLIAVGSYVAALSEEAIKTAEKIGPVTVDMGGTACKVPLAKDYINKVKQKGTIGKKRKTTKC
ncbi:MAG: DNA alkylation repair protein [Bacteroidia bacterium]